MTDWNKYKVVELKKELSSRGLLQSGLKSELVSRLKEDDEAKAAEEGASEEVLDAPRDEITRNGGDTTEQDEESEIVKEKDDVASHSTPTTRDAVLNEEESIAKDPLASKASAEDLATGSEGLEGSTLIETSAEEKEPPQNTLPNRDEAATQEVPPEIESEIVSIIQQPSEIEPSAESEKTKVPQEEAEKIEILKEEIMTDTQKRKRRSLTPDITAEEASKKKMRLDDKEPEPQKEEVVTTQGDAEWVKKHNGVDPAEVNAEAMEVDSSTAGPIIVDIAKEEVIVEQTDTRMNEDAQNNMDFDAESPILSRSKESRYKDSLPASNNIMEKNIAEDPMEGVETNRLISPAIHTPTTALYIRNFMRPLNTNNLKEYLAQLATPPSSEIDLSIISEFHLDNIRTHAFVCFSSISAASRVRSAIHDTIWPEERNRKPLWADFIPAEKVPDWIEEETNTTGGRRAPGKNWEIAYENDDYGSIIAVLRESDPRNIPARQMSMKGVGGMAPPLPPSSRNNMNANNIPLGPRSNIPLDPNPYEKRHNTESRRPSNFQDQAMESSRSHNNGSNKDFMYTITTPRLYFQPVSKELANKRLDNMDRITSQGYKRDVVTKDINRYTFEDGDKFVDRGPEVFEGIRPPRGAIGRFRGGERGGGGGGGGYRGDRSDRRRRDDRYTDRGGGGDRDRGGRRYSGGGGGGFRSDDGYRGGGVRRY